MKRPFWSVIVFLLFFCQQAGAQELFFCSNYSDNGDPIGVSNSWNLSAKGGYVYFLYNNGKKRIKANELIVSILKEDAIEYKMYEKKVMDVPDKKNWAVLDYGFKEEGSYKVSVKDTKGKVLAKGFLTINFASAENIIANEEKTKPDSLQTRNNQDTTRTGARGKDPDQAYYNTNTIFCKYTDKGRPVGEDTKFRTGKVFAFITNDRPLASDSMIVDVFKKAYNEEYTIYVNTLNFKVDPKLKTFYFDLLFEQTGQYILYAYNRRSQRMAKGYVTIH